MLGLLADDQPPRYHNHLTYTKWVSGGLEKTARSLWRNLPLATRQSMKWSVYCTWIRTQFSSQLSYGDAVNLLCHSKQIKSAVAYSQEFNELIVSIHAEGPILPDIFLATVYRNGLKPQLQSDHNLASLRSLLAVQQEAERIDDIQHRVQRQLNATQQSTQSRSRQSNLVPRQSNSASTGSPNNQTQRSRTSQASSSLSTTSNFRPFRSTTQHDQHTDDAMQIDNLHARKRLTDAERAEYVKNNWCVYCRGKDHTVTDCKAPGLRQRKNPPCATISVVSSPATTADRN
ncbi:hypothetical protein DFJ73DRAFT_142251 [Zopfochytrium polystomum]|nr:hypothetical protein DFJ73DRAFT_142251 [Zopfochytrium polystomum]